MNGRTNSSGSSVNDLQIPLDPCTNLECVAGNAQVELTWTDPLNKYATPEGEVAEDPDQLVSVWHHTVVIRKVGSAPVGIDDGIVVVSSEVKNQYQSTAYVDTGLINDTTYYYGVFAVNEDGVESEGLVSEGVTPKLGTPLSELAEGTIIKINENGAPVEFYLAKHNYEPDLNGPGRELLVRKDVFGTNQWHSDYIGDYMPYSISIINALLNSTYKDVLSLKLQQAIGQTSFQITASYDAGTYPEEYRAVSMSAAVFLLSATELFGNEFGQGLYESEGSYISIAPTIIASANGNNTWTRQISPSTRWDQKNMVIAYNTIGNCFWERSYEEFQYYPCFTILNDSLVNSDLCIIETSISA